MSSSQYLARQREHPRNSSHIVYATWYWFHQGQGILRQGVSDQRSCLESFYSTWYSSSMYSQDWSRQRSLRAFRVAMRSYQPMVKTWYGRCPNRSRWDKGNDYTQSKPQRRHMAAAV